MIKNSLSIVCLRTTYLLFLPIMLCILWGLMDSRRGITPAEVMMRDKKIAPQDILVDSNNLYILDLRGIFQAVGQNQLKHVFPSDQRGIESLTHAFALDSHKNYYALTSSHLRKFDFDHNLVMTAGNSKIAKSLKEENFSDGQGIEATFFAPMNLTAFSDGTIFITDMFNHRIRKMSPGGDVSTLSGKEAGFVDGPVQSARFKHPFGIAVDKEKNLYITDAGNQAIRKISAAGWVSTLLKEDLKRPPKTFNSPREIAVNSLGQIYFSDNTQRIFTLATDGKAQVFAGRKKASPESVECFDGQGSAASFGQINGLSFDDQNNLYVADESCTSVRKVSPNGNVTTIIGSPQTPPFPLVTPRPLENSE